jgi:glycosyltransferase 2 family protein
MPTSSRAETPPDVLARGGRLSGRALRLGLIALAGCGAVYVASANFTDGRAALPHVSLAYLPVYLGVLSVVMVLRALRWQIVLRRLGVALGLGRLAQLWLAGRAAGSLIPSGTFAGEPIRAELLRQSGVPITTAAGAVALDRALELSGNMIAGPLSVAAALAFGFGSRLAVMITCAIAVVGLGTFLFVYVRAAAGRPAIAALFPLRRLARFRMFAALTTYARRADDAMHGLITAHPRLVPAGIALSCLIECVQLLELATLFTVFGLVIPVPLLLLSSMGIGVARVVPVSAALGSLEATQVGIFALGGRTVGVGLAVGLVLRIAETFWIVTGLVCLATASRLRPDAVVTDAATSPAMRTAAP